MQCAFIKFVGTHQQYDAVDATAVDQFKQRRQTMEVKAIRTIADYRDSPEGERLEVIGTLVQAYEAQY